MRHMVALHIYLCAIGGSQHLDEVALVVYLTTFLLENIRDAFYITP